MDGGVVGGPCDFIATASPNWTFGFGTSLGLGLLGLWLDNKTEYLRL